MQIFAEKLSFYHAGIVCLFNIFSRRVGQMSVQLMIFLCLFRKSPFLPSQKILLGHILSLKSRKIWTMLLLFSLLWHPRNSPLVPSHFWAWHTLHSTHSRPQQHRHIAPCSAPKVIGAYACLILSLSGLRLNPFLATFTSFITPVGGTAEAHAVTIWP